SKDSLTNPGHALPGQAAGTVHVNPNGRFMYQANRAGAVDTRGAQPRTFARDPSGRILVAANQMRSVVRDGNTVSAVPASLAVFRVGGDGKLS
ncbi:MAG: lactonase family protein, partial [Acidobacteriota bacterium]|nr:lactonase family protein [Acidobacteriota bacterium]